MRLQRRTLLIAAAVASLGGLIAVLAWGMTRPDLGPGGFSINSKTGEVNVPQTLSGASESLLSKLDGRTTLDGSAITMEGMRGKVVMIDFWASWCPPCRQEASTLAAVYREYQDRGVEFVGLSVWDSEGDARGFLRTFGVTYPNILDPRGLLAVDYGVTGIPEKYFVTPEGVIVRKFVGPMDQSRLRTVLDGLLGDGAAS